MEKTWFGVQGSLVIMLVLTLFFTEKLNLNPVGSFLFSFIIAVTLYRLFSIKTIQSDVLERGVPGLL